MSLLIKGMEMPKYGCDHCFLRTGNYCGMIEKDEAVVEYARKNERHPDCPLVPVPPHGELIEADKIYNAVEQRYKMSSGIEHRCYRELLDLICEAPTIIEAEDE